jgi:hypothetical protein
LNPINIKNRKLVFSLVSALLLLIINVTVQAQYTPTSLDGQNGWNGGVPCGTFVNNDAGDESVQGAVFYTGAQAWGYFRGYGSPGCGTPFSPQGVSVGRPSSGAAGDIAVVKFAFKAVSPGDDSIQSLYLGSEGRDDRTGSHIVLRNEPAGVRLTMSTFNPNPPGCNTLSVDVATVSAGIWHTVKMTTKYHEDVSLDVTTYIIDEGTPGEATFQAVSWPHPWRQCNGLGYTPGASLKFANGSADAVTFNGFYYDDVSLVVRNSSNNTVVGSFFTSFELTPPADTDADGISDAIDNCPTTANTDQADTDNDGIGDACEACTDVDVDGVCDNVDNCPTTFNPSQTDADGDSIGDTCDTCSLDPANDVDGDGVCGNVDNCPTMFNPSQQNFDGDSQGDACDNDDDNDGVNDAQDECANTPLGTPVSVKGCPKAVIANQCKNNGWKTLQRLNGTVFKNQGDCIQYVNTGK